MRKELTFTRKLHMLGFYIYISLNFKTTSRGTYDLTHCENDDSNMSIAPNLTAGKIQNQILLLLSSQRNFRSFFILRKLLLITMMKQAGRSSYNKCEESRLNSLSEDRSEGGANSSDTGSFSPFHPCPCPSSSSRHNSNHTPPKRRRMYVHHEALSRPILVSHWKTHTNNLHLCSAHSRLNPHWPVSTFLGNLFSIPDHFVSLGFF